MAELSNLKSEPKQIAIGGLLLKTGALLVGKLSLVGTSVVIVDPQSPGFGIFLIEPFLQHRCQVSVYPILF